jgi:lysine 6-dehydrogenase
MTKVLCLGGAGRICREAALDLVEFSDFEQIIIGDVNEAAGREAAAWLNDPRVSFVRVDVANHTETVARMRAYARAPASSLLSASLICFRINNI